MSSSVIELDHTKTCRSTLFNCTDKQQLASGFAGSPRTVSPDEQWCKLISVLHVPLGTQTIQLPQSLQNIGAIVPRAKERPFLKQQLDGILPAVMCIELSHNEFTRSTAERRSLIKLSLMFTETPSLFETIVSFLHVNGRVHTHTH